MEHKLMTAFEYQRFEPSDRMQRLIKQTEERYGRELSDDDLTFVSAASALPDFKTKDAEEKR